MQLLASVVYDRDIPGDDERGMACYDELAAALAGAGFTPFRLGIHSMGEMARAEPAYTDVLQRLKAAVDPNGVVAPGHYV
jgi:4-cresol dehydrogenase (hydroxylating)